MASKTSTLTIQLIDQISGPAKGAAGGLKGLEGAMARLGKSGNGAANGLVRSLDQLRAKAAAIDNFTGLRRGLKDAALEFRQAKSNVDRLKAALASASAPTKRMQADLAAAQGALARTSAAFKQQGAAVRSAEAALRQFGIAGRSGIAKSQQDIRNEIAKTIREMRRLDRESRMAAAPRASWRERAGGFGDRSGQFAVGAGVAGAMMRPRVERALSYDERVNRMAVTAASGGTVGDMHAMRKRVSDAIHHATKEGGGSREAAANAMEVVLASGVYDPKSAAAVLPTIVKTAHASGADPGDAARLAVSMRRNGVSDKDLQTGLDYALKSGELGSFELKDQARWLPQQLALAKGSGMKGLRAVRELAVLNQVAMTTAANADEAGNNLVNIFQKFNSRELQDTLAKEVKVQKGDPTRTGKSKGKKRGPAEFDWQGYMAKRAQEGVSAVDAFGEIADRQLADNPQYQAIQEKLSATKDEGERRSLLESAADIMEASSLGKIFADRQALMAAIAIRSSKDKRAELNAGLETAPGRTGQVSEFIRSTAPSQVQDMKNAADRANEQSFNAVSGPMGVLAKRTAELAEAFPQLTTALYAVGTVGGSVAAGFGGAALWSKFAGTGAAAAGGGAAAGAAAGAAGAAAKGGGSMLKGAAKGAGIAGLALTLSEVMSIIDPRGNLWGLTDGIDQWVKAKTGINPSNLSDKSGAVPTTGSAPAATSQRIDDVFSQAKMSDPAQIAGSMQAAMQGMNAALQTGFAQALAEADRFMAQMNAKLSQIVAPTIRPRLDMSGVGGVHADVGITP